MLDSLRRGGAGAIRCAAFLVASLLIPRLAQAQVVLDNGLLRFGTGSEDSVDALANLRQPFYWSEAASNFYKLTYSNYPLDIQVGAGAGANWTGSTVVVNPAVVGLTIDSSSYVSTGSGGYGTVVATGDITVNGYTLGLENTYALDPNASYIQITTELTNSTGALVPNVHLWVGTRDDWVGQSDGPTKTKGDLLDGAFVAATDPAALSPALMITSGSEGVLFYSTTPGTNSSIHDCCSFTNATNQDPVSSDLTRSGDGSYAMYLPVGDIPDGGSTSITWFYAAGATADLEQVVEDVAGAAAPTTIEPVVTNDQSPTLVGTFDDAPPDSTHATLEITIDGTTYTEGVDAALVVGAGTWSLDLAAAGHVLAEGTYDVVVEAIAADASSSVDESTDEVVIDLTPPAAPSITPALTAGDPLTISGTWDSADAPGLSVTLDGTTYVLGVDAELTASGDAWSLTVSGIAEGTFDVLATAADAAGNTTDDATSAELEVDRTAPSAPSVTPLLTNVTEPTLAGTWNAAEADALEVTVDGTTYVLGVDPALTTSGDDWSLDLTGAGLGEGLYDVLVESFDGADNASQDTTSDEVVVDLTAPLAPTVAAQLTNDPTPTIRGTFDAADAASLSVTVDGNTYVLGVDAALTASGDDWSLLLTAALAEGTHDVAATAADAAGNEGSVVAADVIEIDVTAPPTPVVNSQSTSASSPVVTGTYDEGDSVTLSVAVDGTTYVLGVDAELTAVAGGWSLVIASIAEGTYDVVATAIDAADNPSVDVGSDELVVDRTAPATPTVSARLTNEAEPTIGGTFDPADAAGGLEVLVAGTRYVFGVDVALTVSGSAWQVSLAGNPLAEGTYDVVVEIRDEAGNLGTDVTTDELEVDLTAPAAPTVAATLTNAEFPVVTGLYDADDADTISVTVDGVTYVHGVDPTLDAAGGQWSLVLTTSPVDGEHDVSVRITDEAGNSIEDASVDELVVDRTPPTAPVVAPVATNTDGPTVLGTYDHQDVALFTVEVDGATYTLGVDPELTALDEVWALAIVGPLPEGTYDVTASGSDAAGNPSVDATSGELVVDRTGPTVPTVAAQLTNEASPTLSGSFDGADAQGGLTVAVGGQVYVLGVDGAVSVDGDAWRFDVPTELPQGTYDVAVTVTDAVGNPTSDVTTDELVVDLTAPDRPTIVPLADDTGHPVLTGTYDASDDPAHGLVVTVSGHVYRLGFDDELSVLDGSWTLDLTDADLLADGVYDVLVTHRDEAGNATSDGTVDELVVFVDADRDGVSDVDEAELGTDPTSADSDGDGVPDGEELGARGTNPFLADSDGDGLADAAEIALGLDPNVADTDGDGLVDGFEVDLRPAPGPDPLVADTDADGLSDLEELFVYRTRYDVVDTDGDGVSDFDERTRRTDPLQPDTDGDGVVDGDELDLGSDPTWFDTDGDGVSDGDEILAGTSPNVFDDPPGGPDTDGDGLSDAFESLLGTDPDAPDTDGDGLLDGYEVERGLSPRRTDTDGDGIEDAGESASSTDPRSVDTDGDGLSDGLELLMGTDPTTPDTDRDGVPDGVEIWFAGSDPGQADTDGDGLSDFDEIFVHSTDPTKVDTDGDHLDDGNEVAAPTSPRVPDSDAGGTRDGDEALLGFDGMFPSDDIASPDADGDGVPDIVEQIRGTDPGASDSDGDGISDGDEAVLGTDPNDADSDGDGLEDGAERAAGTRPTVADTDGDGLRDGAEFDLGTDPLTRDTDRDGIEDGIEHAGLTDALRFDTDGDGLSDGVERRIGTDPLVADTDGDGLIDSVEHTTGTDPLWADTVELDVDGDGLSGADEVALGTDPDVADTDGDGADDGADPCPLDNPDDLDGDGVCNSADVCPLDPFDDSDGDGACDSDDVCVGDDATGDEDGDGVCDGSDACVGDDATGDTDQDGVCESDDVCVGDDAIGDFDGDGYCDDVDSCPDDPERIAAECFRDDQGGCTFDSTGGGALPWVLALLPLIVATTRRNPRRSFRRQA